MKSLSKELILFLKFPLRCQLVLKDFWLQKCSSTPKQLMKNTENQLMNWLIMLFNFVQSTQEEVCTTTFVFQEDPLFSKDLRRDQREESRKESMKGLENMKKSLIPKYFYFYTANTHQCSGARQSLSEIRCLDGREYFGRRTRVCSNVPHP